MAKPSKGCWERNPADSARIAGESPPCTMAKRACSPLLRAARLRSAQRWVRSIAARTSLSPAVDGRQMSSTIITSEPMASCMAMDDSGVSSW